MAVLLPEKMKVPSKIREAKLKTVIKYLGCFAVIFAIYQIGFRLGDQNLGEDGQVAKVNRLRPCSGPNAIPGEECDPQVLAEIEDEDLGRPRMDTAVDKWLQTEAEEAIKKAEEDEKQQLEEAAKAHDAGLGHDDPADAEFGRVLAEWTKEHPNEEISSSKLSSLLPGWFGKSKSSNADSAKSNGAEKSQKVAGQPGNGTVYRFNETKAAVIIENRMFDKLPPMIQHFASVLPPEWPVILFTTSESYSTFHTTSSVAWNRLLSSGRVQIRKLPPGTDFPNERAVSRFLTNPWLWEQLAPAEHLLVFQTDSILCANAPMTVDDFLEYDFIGAPITHGLGRGFNGGLSLRKRSSTLRVLDAFNWTETDTFEDQWYHARLLELKLADKIEKRNETIMIPDYDLAKKFAVETIDYPTPVGLHQPRRYISPDDETLSLDVYCPEWHLTTSPWGQS